MNTQVMAENDFYRTPDLALAGALSLWYPIEAVDFGDSTRAQFLFKRDSGLDSLVQEYWRGELRVDPQAYFGQLRVIKTRLRSNY